MFRICILVSDKSRLRSDGSYSLHLGNEIFDVHKQPLQSDFNHLFIRQGTGLQGQAVFRTKLSFRPHSVDSHTHKKMTLSMADRSTKSNQIKVISHVGHNPDEGRWERIRKEEQGLREALRKDASKKRVSAGLVWMVVSCWVIRKISPTLPR